MLVYARRSVISAGSPSPYVPGGGGMGMGGMGGLGGGGGGGGGGMSVPDVAYDDDDDILE